jgi:subtilisin family serine protease
MLNSDPSVNAGRAAGTGCLAVTKKLIRPRPPEKYVSGKAREAKKAKVKSLKKGAQARREREQVRVNVFVHTRGPLKERRGKRGEYGNFAMMRLPLDEVEKLATRSEIGFIEQAENIKQPGIIRLNTKVSPPQRSKTIAQHAKLHGNGRGVLIGIIDVEGFDWSHSDFLDERGQSRFIAIWDQGGKEKGRTPRTRHKADTWKRFDYGVEILPEDMKKARSEARQIHVSPHDLEPQSQMVPGSHGTHVASIAAGNSGVAKDSKIAAVLISMPKRDLDRRNSFYDSTCLLDAFEYLLAIAEEEEKQISINVSLGTNGHAHDGSGTLDRWIDALLAKPGRSLCVAAGNAGQERSEYSGDLGFMLGRIHTSGQIGAKGLTHDIEWIVYGDGSKDMSENELELWYESQDRIEVSIKPPGVNQWIGPVAPGEYAENVQLPDRTMLSIYSELYNPANGSNYVSIYLTPFISDDLLVGVSPGIWHVRLRGAEIRNGRFDGWIERDDPLDLGDGRRQWPSYFSEQSNVDTSSVGSLACGQRVVSVANLDEEHERVNISSSQGPTRDGRPKPDVAAGGTRILAANGFGDRSQPWIEMSGTSMASPRVAGVIALMFAAAEKQRQKLSASQINGILKATATPLPGSTYQWGNDSGFGVLNAEACIEEATLVSRRRDLEHSLKGARRRAK